MPRTATTLDARRRRPFADRTGVYVGSGGGAFENQYDFFPLMSEAKGDLQAFGRELADTVNPMWLLRTLPNNVLCHVGIRNRLKGTNACITNHSVGGALAVIEAAEALRNGEADRALAIGHDTPIEPQNVLYYHQLRPARDRRACGRSTRAQRQRVRRRRRRVCARNRRVGACAQRADRSAKCSAAAASAKAQGCSPFATTATASRARSKPALADARRRTPRDIGMIVAHGNGTRAIGRVGSGGDAARVRRAMPAGDRVQVGDRASDRRRRHRRNDDRARRACAGNVVPGIATLDATCARNVRGLPLSRERADAAQRHRARADCRGFAGTDAALVVRAARA